MNYKISISHFFQAFLIALILLITGCSEKPSLNKDTAMDLDGTWRASSLMINGEELIPDRWIAVILNFNYTAGNEGSYVFDFIGNQDIGRTPGWFEVTEDGKKLVRRYKTGDQSVVDEYELQLDGKFLLMTKWSTVKEDSISARFTAERQ